MNLIAVSESTPGAIGINMSTYVGFITAGLPGKVATLGSAAPSVVVIILISKMLDIFKGSPVVELDSLKDFVRLLQRLSQQQDSALRSLPFSMILTGLS